MTTFNVKTYRVIKVETEEILEDVRKNSFKSPFVPALPECDSYLGCYEVVKESEAGDKEYIGPYRTQAEANEARVSFTRSQRLLRDGKHIRSQRLLRDGKHVTTGT